MAYIIAVYTCPDCGWDGDFDEVDVCDEDNSLSCPECGAEVIRTS